MPPRSSPADFHQEMTSLRAELKGDYAKLEAEVRVTKHDVKNLHDMFSGLGVRIDKLDEKIAGKIDALAEKLTGVNVQQARGLGFFAGVSAVITIAGGIILTLAKLLFGAHP